jgi:hypothetical protein
MDGKASGLKRQRWKVLIIEESSICDPVLRST